MKKDTAFDKYVKILIVILSIVFSVALISVMVPYVLHNLGVNSCISSPSVSEYYGVFISFLALAFAISIATPYFISKNQIKSVVRKYLETEYKEDVEKSVENFTRTDAHLSRMIAFLLMENHYYYWAIGWAFRALKRYKNLSGDYQKIYKELHEFLLRDVILQCLETITENPEGDKSKDIFSTDSENKEKEANRIKIRAIKDYADFMYEICVLYKNQSYVRDMNKFFNDVLVAISSKMTDLCDVVNASYVGSGKTLFDDVLEISTYRTADTKKDFIDFINNKKLL